MASLAKAGVAGASQVQVVLKDSPVLLTQVFFTPLVLKPGLHMENYSMLFFYLFISRLNVVTEIVQFLRHTFTRFIYISMRS